MINTVKTIVEIVHDRQWPKCESWGIWNLGKEAFSLNKYFTESYPGVLEINLWYGKARYSWIFAEVWTDNEKEIFFSNDDLILFCGVRTPLIGQDKDGRV